MHSKFIFSALFTILALPNSAIRHCMCFHINVMWLAEFNGCICASIRWKYYQKSKCITYFVLIFIFLSETNTLIHWGLVVHIFASDLACRLLYLHDLQMIDLCMHTYTVRCSWYCLLNMKAEPIFVASCNSLHRNGGFFYKHPKWCSSP